MKYIELESIDPRYNLAAEQYLFDCCDRAESYLMLWRNDNTIVVGKHQNTAGEVNAEYVREHDITVVRRLSGGGAVYHDLGNLNYTFITDDTKKTGFDFAAFCEPVAIALRSLGVMAELSGRNDITIEGKKISGNAQYRREGRVMHHGTLLFDSDLTVLQKALQVAAEKLESKGVASVQSRVANIRPYLKELLSTKDFLSVLRQSLFSQFSPEWWKFSGQDGQRINEIKRMRYDTWDWNYGASPAYALEKSKRIEGIGKIEIRINAGVGGVLENLAFSGDYFGDGQEELAARLIGVKLVREAVKSAVSGFDIGRCFHNLTEEMFLSILLD